MARPRLRRLALRDVMTRGHQVPAAEAVRLAASSLRCEIVDDVFAVLRNGDPTLHGLQDITCPVLVTWGDQDRILPLAHHAPRLRAEIPGVEFRVHRGIGHTPMWDDPGLMAADIGDFAAAAAVRPPLTGTPPLTAAG